MAEPSATTEFFGEEKVFRAAASGGERLDVFCAALSGETRSFAQRMIEAGDVTVNDKESKSGQRLKAGDTVELRVGLPKETELVPEDIPLSIVYEDGDIAVIDKPKGMVVHPAPGNESGTLVNAVMYAIRDLSGIGGELRPGIVHRIDKMTSGLIVIAKNDFAHRGLAAQMKTHEAGRIYLALVDDNIKQDFGIVNAPIGRHPVDRKRMAIRPDGREAVTSFRVLERMGAYTLIAAKLKTGRTHQIRVHMASIKHPVSGDSVYGPEKNSLGLDGQALHAARLTLCHPVTGARLTFRAPVPDWFEKALARAGHDPLFDLDALIDGAVFDEESTE